MKHRAEFDVAKFLLLVIAIHEIAASVALPELGLNLETLQLDRLGGDRL